MLPPKTMSKSVLEGCLAGLLIGGLWVTPRLQAQSVAPVDSGRSHDASGDLNCDGLIGFADIDPFVLALTSQAGYEAQFPLCNWLNGDCNDDNQVDFGDIEPFVALPTGG